MIQDKFQTHATSKTMPPEGGFVVVPNDAQDLREVIRGVMVAVAGDVRVALISGDVVTLPSLRPGVQYAFRATQIFASGTTASGIVGLV